MVLNHYACFSTILQFFSACTVHVSICCIDVGSALTAIPEEIEAAAESLSVLAGNNAHVILPMAKSGLIGAGLVVLTLSLTDFAMPAILGGGTQDFV